MLPDFNWKRFWVPRGSLIDLSDSGYFYDPESEWGRFYNPQAVSLDRLIDFPFLALLGEPGMGKTRVLKREVEQIRAQLAEKGEKIISFNLRSFGSEDRLVNALFQSEEFKQWRQGNDVLHLFLDSLDECLLRIDNVGSLLVDELAKVPINRLRIRIACRTARWPSILESGAQELFGKNGFDAHELTPLRKMDVALAANEAGLPDPSSFMKEISELNAVPLAIKPVTLRFLLTMYLRNGRLANDQLQLYEEGCRILCEEVNENRRSSGNVGDLTTDQRFAIALRIAAVTQFTNRFAVWTGTQAEGVPDEDVAVDQVSGGREVPDVPVTNDAVREVLDTGLFSSRGPNRVGWAHQTYAEFLAAKFAQKKTLPLTQVKSLLFYSVSIPPRIVPQLSEVAAWLGALNPSVFQEVAATDPEVLLSAAAAGLSYDSKRALIDALLAVCEKGRLLNLRWELFRFYDKLKHPDVAVQLRPYLVDKQKSEIARDLAVGLARTCEIEELMPTLVDLALDQSEHRSIRIHAAAAVAYGSSAGQKARLRPLLVENDPDDEFKGLALRALWPISMEAEELFSLISVPKLTNLSGAYTSFLYDLAKEIPASALKSGLHWFACQLHRSAIPGAVGLLMDAVIKKAWDHLEDTSIVEEFVEAILSRLNLHDYLVGGSDQNELYAKVAKDEIKRHWILERLLPRLQLDDTSRIIHFERGFVVASDQSWLIERIIGDVSPGSKLVEAKLVWYFTDSRDPDAMSRLWSGCQKDSVLNAECGRIFNPIALDAPEVEWLRESQREKQPPGPKFLDPPPATRIQQDLVASESGNASAWLNLAARDLLLESTGAEIGYQLGPTDLSTTPGWQSADEPTRLRILDSALQYLRKADPKNDDWVMTSSMPLVAVAGYQALELLLRQKKELLDAVDVEAWKKWVPIILRHRFGGTPEIDIQATLVKQSYIRVPAEFTRLLIQTVESENARGHLFVLQGLTQCWDDKIGIALLEKTKDSSVKPEVQATLLCELLEHGVPGAEEFAKSLIIIPPPQEEADLLRMEKAAEALVSGGKGAGWTYLKALFDQYPSFGKKVLESRSYAGAGFPRFLGHLSEFHLAELYIWMVKQYPYKNGDDNSENGGTMSAVDAAMMFRDHILQHLKKKATFAAVEGFRSIMRALPELSWLRYHLDETETLTRANTWRPLTPVEFLELTKSARKRVVSNGTELLNAVVESLRRFEAALHGELTPVRNLWNSIGGKWFPKDEEHLSDNIALHLDRDLREQSIIVNREVQIRRSRGKDVPGQSTDIHVDTIALSEGIRDSKPYLSRYRS